MEPSSQSKYSFYSSQAFSFGNPQQRMADLLQNLGQDHMGWTPAFTDYKQLLEQLKSQDELTVYQAVMNLQQSLSVAQENTLQNFSLDQYIPTLIDIIKKPSDSEVANEVNMMAVHSLINLMDIFPNICNSIINHGGVKGITELLERTLGFDGLNEACIKAFEKISLENPYAILTSGALLLCLNIMDFFELNTQKRIIQLVSNVSRHSASEQDFDSYIMSIVPNITILLTLQNDPTMQQRTEILSHIILRICESFQRFFNFQTQFDKVCQQYQKLVNAGFFEGVIQGLQIYSINQSQKSEQESGQKLKKNQQSKNLSTITVQNYLKVLTLCCRYSGIIAKQLIEQNILEILNGFLPSQEEQKKSGLSSDRFPFTIEVIQLLDTILPERDHSIKLNEVDKLNQVIEHQKREIYLKIDQTKIVFLAEKLLPKIFLVYDNNIGVNIRLKALQIIEKMISLFNEELLNNFIEPYSFAKFIYANLQQANPTSVFICLQMIQKLLISNSKTYTLPLIREGVVEHIKKYQAKEQIEQNLNLKSESERTKLQQLEDEAAILQAKAVLLGQQPADESQRAHFEQILQKYLEHSQLQKQQLGQKVVKGQTELSTKILELSQILSKEYFDNEKFMTEVNSSCKEEFQLFEDLKKLTQQLLEEAQKINFDYDQNKQLMRQLQMYLTNNRNIMLYEFKQTGLLEALQIYLTCSPKQAKYVIEQKKALEKGEELKRSEELQMSSLNKEGKKVSKKEGRCFLQRLKMFAHFILNEKNKKRGINELVQLCHDILSQSENIIFEGQMGNEGAQASGQGFLGAGQATDLNQSVNALKQLTKRVRVNLIYDQNKKLITSIQENISPLLEPGEQSKDLLKQDKPDLSLRSRSHNPAFLQIGIDQEKDEIPTQSKVYGKRNLLYVELKQVLIAVEQCASLYLIEDFLRNKIKSMDDVKTLKQPQSFLDQIQKNSNRQENQSISKSALAREVLEKALLKMRIIFDSSIGSRPREETEEFMNQIAEEISNVEGLTEVEQDNIIRQLETSAMQLMDDLYAQEDQALEEMRSGNNIEAYEERLLSQGNEEDLVEAEQKLYEFQKMLEKLKGSFKNKPKAKTEAEPKQQPVETKEQESSKEELKESEKKAHVLEEKKDEEMEDQSEDVTEKEEQEVKDVEMTDEEEEQRRFIAEQQKIYQKQQNKAQEINIQPDTEVNQLLNEDLEELIKANGEDIEYEFYSNTGVKIQPNLTIFEVQKSIMANLPQLSKNPQKNSYYNSYGSANETVTIYFTIRDKKDDQVNMNRKDSILEFGQGRRERAKSEAVDDISASAIDSIVQQMIEKEFNVFSKDLQEKLKQKQYSNEEQLEQSLRVLKVINYICKNIQLFTNQGMRFLVNSKALNDEEVKEPGFTDIDLLQNISEIHPNLFHHHKLDVFILKNIQDPFTLMGGAISESLQQIFRNCPFLFPFQTRELFFKLISFIGAIDMNRSIYFLRQFIKHRGGKINQEDKTGIKFVKQKVNVERGRIIESGIQLVKKMNKRAFIEFEFKDEIGTGMGPTLEFYALFADEIKTKRSDLWRKLPDNTLFPAPLQMQKLSNEEIQKVYEIFTVMGTMIAKSIVDDRLIDLPISPLWWDLLLGKKMNIFDLDRLNSEVYKVIADLQLLANKKREIDKQINTDPDSKLRQIHSLKTSSGCHVEDLSLYFVLPGFENIELKADGANTQVTIHNLQDYIDLLMHSVFYETIKLQTQAFKKGFNAIFPIEQLKPFSTNQELEDMICGTQRNEEEWKNPQKLMENIIPDHGYHSKSTEYHNFIKFMTELDTLERRKFLKFVTGSPRLPNGGFGALEPKLTIVLRKETDPFKNPDNTLPSVMTCQNYLKMPGYSSYEILKKQFELAYNEGINNFTLS